MAVIRRQKRVFIVLLIVSFVSLIYLLFSLPPKGDMMSFPGQDSAQVKEHQQKPVSVTRKHSTTTHRDNQRKEPVMNVLPAPHFPPDGHNLDLKHRNMTDMGNSSGRHKNITGMGNNNGSKAVQTKKPENLKKESEKLSVKSISSLNKNKTYELGIKMRNKTVVVGEKIKNKTLEQLGVIGAASKRLSQLMFVQHKWNLSVSFEDIGDIMKETQFLNKVDPLNLNGPILLSSRNRTANFTYAMPLKFGYCDCFERFCVCCSQITNKRLHLNSTACSNFTFVSKTHELDLKFSMEGKLVHKALISADKSPLMCLGSIPKVADICVHFFNMTFRVNEHNAAQTQLLGCTDLSLNLYNRTIGAFPVDCFQIPGDPNQVHKERKFHMNFNWMP